MLGYPQPAQHGPARAGDVRDSLADITRGCGGAGLQADGGVCRGAGAYGGVVSREQAGRGGLERVARTVGMEAADSDRSARVGIVGMGYVGLPLALLLSEDGFRGDGLRQRLRARWRR